MEQSNVKFASILKSVCMFVWEVSSRHARHVALNARTHAQTENTRRQLMTPQKHDQMVKAQHRVDLELLDASVLAAFARRECYQLLSKLMPAAELVERRPELMNPVSGGEPAGAVVPALPHSVHPPPVAGGSSASAAGPASSPEHLHSSVRSSPRSYPSSSAYTDASSHGTSPLRPGPVSVVAAAEPEEEDEERGGPWEKD
jgi:hypothetical protein